MRWSRHGENLCGAGNALELRQLGQRVGVAVHLLLDAPPECVDVRIRAVISQPDARKARRVLPSVRGGYG